MNRFSFLKYPGIVLSSLMFLVSCDKDYNTVGADIIGDDNYLLESTTYPVTTYNQYDNVVQTNNLPLNQLGVIDNGAQFGVTTSSFVTQLQLSQAYTVPPTAVIDYVELVVPYFSTQLTSDADGLKTYELDSIYPSDKTKRGKIKLSVYESTKFLDNFDGLLNPLRHYSDEFAVFETYRKTVKLNDDSNVSQNSEFQFSEAQQEEITIENSTNVETTTKVAPRMRLKLSNAEFQNILINGGNYSKLLDNGTFQVHFRGLFFKVENVGTERALALMNFAAGKVYVYYKELSTDTKRKAIVLNMTGNNVNLFQNQYSATLPTNNIPAIATNNLYLKGGSGFHSYVDLFGDADATGVIPKEAIASLKTNNWLINEANLVFTVDNDHAPTEIPRRIYLYNVQSRKPIIDYYTDGTGSSTQPKYAKSIYGGIVSNVTKDGVTTTKYKIKITNHLRNIIQNDSLNVRLGLSVTEDIAKIGNRYSKNTPDNAYYNRLPEASVINPLGTILYGSDASINASKRVKLEIFYTKPN
jgi:hypothetical protein